MAIETCGACRQTFAVGLFRCPRCKTLAPRYAAAATLIKKGLRTMPRITVGAGPTNADAAEGEVGFLGRAEHEAEKVIAEVKTDVRDAEAWAEKSVAHLREAAKDRGLSAAGSKADLAARLAEHEAANSPAAEVAPAETEPAAADVKG